MTDGRKPPDDPTTSGDWSGPQLDADGRLVGERPRPQHLALVPEPAPEKFELDRKPPPRVGSPLDPVAYRDDLDAVRARQRRRRLAAVVVLLGVGALAMLGAFLAFPRLQRALPFAGVGGSRHSLLLMSEPSGATILIGGQPVGTTPFAADNLYTGPVSFELRLRGYQSFKGSFTGGTDAHLSAQLKKQ